MTKIDVRKTPAPAAYAEKRRMGDQKILAIVLQAGRAIGWQRIVPIVLLGFMATQSTREHRENRNEGASNNRRSD